MHAHRILRSLYIDILCMQLIKISNHEIMNHNLFIYLIECASCVPVWTEDSSLTQSANNHPCFLQLMNAKTASMHIKSLKYEPNQIITKLCFSLLSLERNRLFYEYCAEMGFTSFENPEMPLNLLY